MNTLGQHLGWLLLNTAWEMAAIWAGLRLALLLLRRHAAQTRYLVGCGFLLAALISPLVAFVRLKQELQQPVRLLVAAEPDSLAPAFRRESERQVPLAYRIAVTQLMSGLRPILPWLALAWAVGCTWQCIRLFSGWRAARKLFEGPRKIPSDTIAERCAVRANALGIKRPFTVAESILVDVPSVVGCLSPVLLLPTGAFTGLSQRQIDGVLDHELAHIRRSDAVVNLVQCVSEALGFYHPAIFAINRHVRAEREHACDEVAIASGANSLEYAQALAQLEETRSSRWVLAAVSEGALTPRIHRLLGKSVPAPAPSLVLGWSMALSAGLFLSGLSLSPAVIGLLAFPNRLTSPRLRPAWVPGDYQAQINARLLIAHPQYAEILTDFDPPATLSLVSERRGDARDHHYAGVGVRWQPANRSAPEATTLFLYEDGRLRGQVSAADVIMQPLL